MPYLAQESLSDQPSECKPRVKPPPCYSDKERKSCEHLVGQRRCVERGQGEEGCFEYVVVLCLRGVAVGSSVMRWRTSVTAGLTPASNYAPCSRFPVPAPSGVKRRGGSVNTVCPHLSDCHMKRHRGAKARTWREKTRRAEDLLKEPPARYKRHEAA